MYCQNCGELIADRDSSCQHCGKKVNRSAPDFPWRALSLMLILALVVLAVALLGPPSGESGQVRSGEILSAEAVQQQNRPAETAPVQPEPAQAIENDVVASAGPVLPESYPLPISYGDTGPRLLESGAIHYERFVQLYERAGQPLSETELAILTEGSEAEVVFGRANAYFLLNFFWALGLTNQNPLLDEGPLKQYSEGNVGRFASVGGWSIGRRPAVELYSSTPLISLSPEQQERLENVANNVYRPCCNNHTAFADCNHGMAMLGLLELMAENGATEDEMFEAAKYVNSFWFPQQALEAATFFQRTMNLTYDEVDERMAAGPEVFSSSGFQVVHQWLASNGQLEKSPEAGGSCGV